MITMPFRHKKVLIIEDDNEINLLLTKMLTNLQVNITNAYAGTEGLYYFEKEKYDLVLLDLMLPGVAGEIILQKIREKSKVPVIIISAKTTLQDKVNMLKGGADDYIIKPFHQDEVLARVEVQLRRFLNEENLIEGLIQYESIELNTKTRQVSLDGHVLSLTITEYDIMQLLLKQPGHVFSKKEIFEAVGKGIYLGDDNTVSVHISNIRKKMLNISDREYIKTVWGIGFMLE